MRPALLRLIERFREAQDQGVAFIIDVLGPAIGVRWPKSPSDWVYIYSETGLWNVRRMNRVEVYCHGHGIELIFPGLTIDFDWGDAGEPDGFDAWRLWNFAFLNPDGSPCPEHSEIRTWIEQAAADGELERDAWLHYSPRHRALRKQRPSATPSLNPLQANLLDTIFETPQHLLDALIAIFPQFRQDWEDDETPDTFHHVMIRFSSFLSPTKHAACPRTLRQLGSLINQAVAAGGVLENAASTCLLEHLRQIGFWTVLFGFLDRFSDPIPLFFKAYVFFSAADL